MGRAAQQLGEVYIVTFSPFSLPGPLLIDNYELEIKMKFIILKILPSGKIVCSCSMSLEILSTMIFYCIDLMNIIHAFMLEKLSRTNDFSIGLA